MGRAASELGRCRTGAPVAVTNISRPSIRWRLSRRGRARIREWLRSWQSAFPRKPTRGGGRLARQWEWRVSAGGSPPHSSAVFLGPAPRKLRWGRDHRLNDVPLEMRSRASRARTAEKTPRIPDVDWPSPAPRSPETPRPLTGRLPCGAQRVDGGGLAVSAFAVPPPHPGFAPVLREPPPRPAAR